MTRLEYSDNYVYFNQERIDKFNELMEDCEWGEAGNMVTTMVKRIQNDIDRRQQYLYTCTKNYLDSWYLLILIRNDIYDYLTNIVKELPKYPKGSPNYIDTEIQVYTEFDEDIFYIKASIIHKNKFYVFYDTEEPDGPMTFSDFIEFLSKFK